MGTVGPSFTVNESALALLTTMPEEIPIERLVELGIHVSVETAMRHNKVFTVKKSTVYEWITLGIPGTIGCVGEPGPLGYVEPKSTLPWYVSHLMKQSRRSRAH